MPGERGGRLDARLAAYVALELTLVVMLCRNSAGAWYNYGLEAVVCLAVLVARALDRIVAAERISTRLVPLGLACLALLAADVRHLGKAVLLRREAHAEMRALLADPRVASISDRQRYFSGPLQHYNLRRGRPELAHDEWLYGAFEAIGAAEPRPSWLQEALVHGPIRQVVVPLVEGSEPPVLSGLSATLPELGFAPVARLGEYSVWERSRPEGVALDDRRY